MGSRKENSGAKVKSSRKGYTSIQFKLVEQRPGCRYNFQFTGTTELWVRVWNMDSKNTTAEFGNVRARNDCMISSTNNSSNLLIGDSVLGENSNIIRKVVENDKDLILKKSYGEFYCRGCDRSWCSKNVWVVCNSRRVYIKRTCNQCHKVIEPWYLAK